MRSRLFAAACALTVLVGAPGLAQSPAELIGEYHLTVTSKTGTDCTNDTALDLNVKSIEGDKLMLGARDEEKAFDYHPASMSFRYEEPPRGMDGGDGGKVTGRFLREPDAVRMTMKVEIKTCTVELTGSRPAPHLAVAATTPPAIQAPAPAAAPVQAAAPAPDADGKGQRGLLFWAPLGALLVIAGGFVGWLVGRSRKKPADKGDDHA